MSGEKAPCREISFRCAIIDRLRPHSNARRPQKQRSCFLRTGLPKDLSLSQTLTREAAVDSVHTDSQKAARTSSPQPHADAHTPTVLHPGCQDHSASGRSAPRYNSTPLSQTHSVRFYNAQAPRLLIDTHDTTDRERSIHERCVAPSSYPRYPRYPRCPHCPRCPQRIRERLPSATDHVACAGHILTCRR